VVVVVGGGGGWLRGWAMEEEGGRVKKTIPCPRVINQRTKAGGEETRVIQFHGWNINNGVRGPWIISGRRGISRTSISTPFANNLTSVPPRLKTFRRLQPSRACLSMYIIYTRYSRIDVCIYANGKTFPARTPGKFQNVK